VRLSSISRTMNAENPVQIDLFGVSATRTKDTRLAEQSGGSRARYAGPGVMGGDSNSGLPSALQRHAAGGCAARQGGSRRPARGGRAGRPGCELPHSRSRDSRTLLRCEEPRQLRGEGRCPCEGAARPNPGQLRRPGAYRCPLTIRTTASWTPLTGGASRASPGTGAAGLTPAGGRAAAAASAQPPRPATRLTVAARMTAPNRKDSRAWRRAADRMSELCRLVSETWKVIPRVSATYAKSR